MKKKQRHNLDKVYLRAVEEIEEVKVIVKQVLEGIDGMSFGLVARLLLKQDLEDIRRGKVNKIKARFRLVARSLGMVSTTGNFQNNSDERK